MKNEVTFSDKIMLLKGIEIFEGLSVGELAAIASVVEEIDCPVGEIIIKEGSAGDTLYLMIEGEVSVIKDLGEINEVEIDRMTSGENFGEMALFEYGDHEPDCSFLRWNIRMSRCWWAGWSVLLWRANRWCQDYGGSD